MGEAKKKNGNHDDGETPIPPDLVDMPKPRLVKGLMLASADAEAQRRRADAAERVSSELVFLLCALVGQIGTRAQLVEADGTPVGEVYAVIRPEDCKRLDGGRFTIERMPVEPDGSQRLVLRSVPEAPAPVVEPAPQGEPS